MKRTENCHSWNKMHFDSFIKSYSEQNRQKPFWFDYSFYGTITVTIYCFMYNLIDLFHLFHYKNTFFSSRNVLFTAVLFWMVYLYISFMMFILWTTIYTIIIISTFFLLRRDVVISLFKFSFVLFSNIESNTVMFICSTLIVWIWYWFIIQSSTHLKNHMR